MMVWFALAALAICYAPVMLMVAAAYRVSIERREDDAFAGFLIAAGIVGLIDLIPIGVFLKAFAL